MLRPGAVTVEDGRVVAVGQVTKSHKEVVRLEGLLMPGLVNCHCHSPMTLFRGAAEDVPLQRFLQEVLWPREAKLEPEDVYWGTTLACAELLRNGVTTFCDMYTFEDAILAVAAAARERDALLHIHVAETREEAGHPAALAELGVFEGRVLAAHSVWLSDDDLRLYREHDVAVAHCPQANAKLASGTARLAEMLALALRVGLGTDSTAANNDLDLWEELRLAPLLAKLQTGDAAVVPAPEALALATRAGARALGRDDLGALEPGRHADMVLLRLDDPAFVPLVEERDLLSHLVWSAASRLVEAVWVEGEQVVAEGRALRIDEERARAEVQTRAGRLARVR